MGTNSVGTLVLDILLAALHTTGDAQSAATLTTFVYKRYPSIKINPAGFLGEASGQGRYCYYAKCVFGELSPE